MPPTLRTPRLSLTILAAADRDDFVRAWAESAAHFAPWTPALPPGWTWADLFAGQLERARTGLADGTQYRFVARDRAGALVGFFALSEVVRGAFWNAYASWSVVLPHLRRGYATEGARALLDFAFAPAPEGLGLHRVQANVIPENVASVGVVEKLGFREEGLARGYLRIAGRWQDHRMFAKLAEEHR